MAICDARDKSCRWGLSHQQCVHWPHGQNSHPFILFWRTPIASTSSGWDAYFRVEKTNAPKNQKKPPANNEQTVRSLEPRKGHKTSLAKACPHSVFGRVRSRPRPRWSKRKAMVGPKRTRSPRHTSTIHVFRPWPHGKRHAPSTGG